MKRFISEKLRTEVGIDLTALDVNGTQKYSVILRSDVHQNEESVDLQLPQPIFNIPKYMEKWITEQYNNSKALLIRLPNGLQFSSEFLTELLSKSYMELQIVEEKLLSVKTVQSSIPNSGYGLKATKIFSEGETIGYYYGCFVRRNLSLYQSYYVIEKDLEWVTHQYFEENALQISIVKDSNLHKSLKKIDKSMHEQETTADEFIYLVPFPFCHSHLAPVGEGISHIHELLF